jgi:phage pi2 protein 07
MELIIQGKAGEFPSPCSEQNEVATCFSFLVQHVDHRIVATIKQNNVILIHKATVYSDGTITIQDTPEPCSLSKSPPLASIPMTEGSDQITTWAHDQLRSQSWEVQGIVFKDQSGNRWRFRSESYLAVRSLRGNASSIVDRFVQLYLQNLAHTYLEYYPEDSVMFSFHQEMMNFLIHSIYTEYQQLHVRKTTTIDKINKMYHPHLYSLHGHYLSQLRSANKKVTLNEVHDYLRKQPWQRISFLLRGIQDVYYGMIQAT